MVRVLVVEDEANIRDMIALNLRHAGMEVVEAESAEAALPLLAQKPGCDAAILDVMLPGMNGFSLCETIRRTDQQIGIIILSAKGQEQDKIRGLSIGADDYMTKPFSTRELVSRIKAVLRRANALSGEKTIDANGLILDPVSQRVSFGDNILEMGPTEYRLLAFFMTHPERAYTRAQLLDQVWGGNVYIEDRTIDVHIRRLRKVLEPYGVDRFVQTVRGTGYRFSTRADVALG